MVVIWPLSTSLIKPNFNVSLSHWCSNTVSLQTWNFLSIALWTVIYLTWGCFHLQHTIHHTKGTKRPPEQKLNGWALWKKMFTEMEMVNLGFNGENPLWIQCNLNKPHNNVNGNATTYKLPINNRSKIPYPRNNNYQKDDNWFYQMSW